MCCLTWVVHMCNVCLGICCNSIWYDDNLGIILHCVYSKPILLYTVQELLCQLNTRELAQEWDIYFQRPKEMQIEGNLLEDGRLGGRINERRRCLVVIYKFYWRLPVLIVPTEGKTRPIMLLVHYHLQLSETELQRKKFKQKNWATNF